MFGSKVTGKLMVEYNARRPLYLVCTFGVYKYISVCRCPDGAEKFTSAEEQQPLCPDTRYHPHCQHQPKQVPSESGTLLTTPHSISFLCFLQLFLHLEQSIN